MASVGTYVNVGGRTTIKYTKVPSKKVRSGDISGAVERTGGQAEGERTQLPSYTFNGQVVDNPNMPMDNAEYDLQTRAQPVNQAIDYSKLQSGGQSREKENYVETAQRVANEQKAYQSQANANISTSQGERFVEAPSQRQEREQPQAVISKGKELTTLDKIRRKTDKFLEKEGQVAGFANLGYGVAEGIGQGGKFLYEISPIKNAENLYQLTFNREEYIEKQKEFSKSLFDPNKYWEAGSAFGTELRERPARVIGQQIGQVVLFKGIEKAPEYTPRIINTLEEGLPIGKRASISGKSPKSLVQRSKESRGQAYNPNNFRQGNVEFERFNKGIKNPDTGQPQLQRTRATIPERKVIENIRVEEPLSNREARKQYEGLYQKKAKQELVLEINQIPTKKGKYYFSESKKINTGIYEETPQFTQFKQNAKKVTNIKQETIIPREYVGTYDKPLRGTNIDNSPKMSQKDIQNLARESINKRNEYIINDNVAQTRQRSLMNRVTEFAEQQKREARVRQELYQPQQQVFEQKTQLRSINKQNTFAGDVVYKEPIAKYQGFGSAQRYGRAQEAIARMKAKRAEQFNKNLPVIYGERAVFVAEQQEKGLATIPRDLPSSIDVSRNPLLSRDKPKSDNILTQQKEGKVVDLVQYNKGEFGQELYQGQEPKLRSAFMMDMEQKTELSNIYADKQDIINNRETIFSRQQDRNQERKQDNNQDQVLREDLDNKQKEKLDIETIKLFFPPPPPPPPIFEPPRFKPPKIRTLPYKRPENKEKKKMVGFNVFTRQRGKLVKITPKPLSEAEAINFGQFYVGTTARASFKLEASKGELGVFKGQGFAKDFYKNNKGFFIEKRGRRIKSVGEKREITYKGIASNRGKRKIKNIFGR